MGASEERLVGGKPGERREGAGPATPPASEAASQVTVDMPYADAYDLCDCWTLTYGEGEGPGCTLRVQLTPRELECFRRFQAGDDISECVPYATKRKNIALNFLLGAAVAALSAGAILAMYSVAPNPFLMVGVTAAFLAAMYLLVCKVGRDKVHDPAPSPRGGRRRSLGAALAVFLLLLLFILGLGVAINAGDWFIDAFGRLAEAYPTHAPAESRIPAASGESAALQAVAERGRG